MFIEVKTILFIYKDVCLNVIRRCKTYLMRSAATLGLLLAIVVGLLSLTQFGSIQSALQGLTAGPLNTYLGTMQFVWILLVVLIAVGGLASVIAVFMGRR